jgi:uncharacterized protein (UPF0218 family)
MFERDLVLPASARECFKEPIGTELYDKDLESFDAQTALITVGDVVSLTFRMNGVKPDLSIYDGVTERRSMTEFAELVSEEPKDEVSNPAGTITAEMADMIRKSMEGSGTGLIRVDGEEDLALLPVIHYAPIGSNVVYGWPGKCMMLITTDELTKKKVAGLVARMEEKE